ncbi:MAG: organomercurial transporter MerC [Burkholderiales bacterium]
MNIFTRLADKTGSFGAVIAAMGCASCFPAIASLGSALGLGFLGRYEGVFINTLLPIFAAIALVSNALAWFSHQQWRRTLLGLAGPAMVLATLYLFWTDNWSTYLFYTGIALMLVVSIWDLVRPAHKMGSSCEIPAKA